MPESDKKPVEPVEFVSPRATIYLSGHGHPFPPGSAVPLHPEHAEAFKAADLHKPLPAAAGEAKETPAALVPDKPDGKAAKV